MRIVLAPVGTRGDIQPAVVLAGELVAGGHDCLVVAPPDFRDFVTDHGIAFEPCGSPFRDFMERLHERPFLELVAERVPEQFDVLRSVVRGADALVGVMLQVAGPSVAESAGIPYFSIIPSPLFVESRDHAPVSMRRECGARRRNRIAWDRRGREWRRAIGPVLDGQRPRLGLAPVDDPMRHTLHHGIVVGGFERALVPELPRTVAPIRQTGALYLDGAPLAPELESFCREGAAPVFLGFGSMLAGDPRRLLETILGAVQQTGVRAVVHAGWADLGGIDLPAHCRLVQAAPFGRLFPLCAAAIHHGGAGTTAEAAAAGIPQAIVPHFADQFDWGARIHRLGLGPAPVPVAELDRRRLAALIEGALAPRTRERAALVATSIDRGAGVRMTAALVAEACGRGKPQDEVARSCAEGPEVE